MCQFIETIRVERGEVCNRDYHIKRIDVTRQHIWSDAPALPLSDVWTSVDKTLEKAKLRFVYGRDFISEISCVAYEMPNIRTLKIVTENDIDYRFKSADRGIFNRLKAQRGECDDVLIVKKGHITDTSFTNVAFFDGCRWYTPDTPLLAGTRRKSLLDKGLLHEREIMINDLPSYTCISLFNAMIDLGELVIPIKNIF